MKFLHLGDLHLGKSLGDFDLIDDQKYILNQIINLAEEKKADAVLIAGDVYDKPIPSEAAVNLLDEFISTLAEKKIKTFIISGNHDSDERLNFGSNVFKKNNIFITSKYKGTLESVQLSDEFGQINIYLLPFVKASMVKRFYPSEEINTYDDAFRVIMDNAKIDRNSRNILLAHQFVVSSAKETETSGSESIGTLQVGLVEKINADHFDAFDYVALGHIHRPQAVGREQVRYSGSPLKYSLSEVNSIKTVPVITIEEKGKLEIEYEELKPLRDMRELKGPFKTLLAKENLINTEDFIYVTLTDEDLISDAMPLFQQTYPYTVRITYDNSRTKAVESIDLAQCGKDKSFSELISDFYKQIYGIDIPEEELQVMNEVAKEVGLQDETN